MDIQYTQTDELLEKRAIEFWDGWFDEHPEYEEIVRNAAKTLMEQKKKKHFELYPKAEKVPPFGYGGAMLLLYRLFQYGYIPR